jgi:hypothetical protein
MEKGEEALEVGRGKKKGKEGEEQFSVHDLLRPVVHTCSAL